MKSYLSWLQTVAWCKANPDKLAAIVTREGIFEVKFTPKVENKDKFAFTEFDEIVNSDWIKKRFLDKQ